MERYKIPVVSDVLANGIRGLSSTDTWGDFSGLPKPNLIISLGRSIVSKKLRTYLRSIPTLEIHLLEEREVGNPYDSQQICISDPQPLIDQLSSINAESQQGFYDSWEKQDYEAKKMLEGYNLENSELNAVSVLIQNLPENAQFHLSNSLSVRYGSLLNSLIPGQVKRWSNRGTNGIDGCISTAVGHAWADPKSEHFLIIGDQAFFYDQNALWNNELPGNLKILLLNNQGGRIFESLEATRAQKELNELFVAPHQRNASLICQDLGIGYTQSETSNELESWVKLTGQTRIFEFISNKDASLDIYKKVNRLI